MQRSGLIAKKMGMSSVFIESGRRIPVTVLEISCCVVAQRVEKEFCSLQVGAGKPKHVSKPQRGYFSKAGVAPRAYLKEFRVDPRACMPVGALLGPDYFVQDQFVDVTGVTIGRGFAGPMKRHHFSGLRASHGVSVSHRSHGSTGQRKDPGKVLKGKKMAGHMGCQRVTMLNLRVVSVDIEDNLLIVQGAVPGCEGRWVFVRDAVKKVANTPVPTFSEDSLEKVSVSASAQPEKGRHSASKKSASVKAASGPKGGGSEKKPISAPKGGSSNKKSALASDKSAGKKSAPSPKEGSDSSAEVGRGQSEHQDASSKQGEAE